MQDMLRTQVRIPKELADWLKQKAKENHRSMNSQLVEFLEQQKRRAHAA